MGSRQFLVVAFEQMWMLRNKVWKGDSLSNWTNFSLLVNWVFHSYWKQCIEKHNHLSSSASQSRSWLPPLTRELKLNCDAAFKDGEASSGVVLRDDHGTILGAWTNYFKADNSFCIEAEAGIQALKVADELRLDKITIEGDAHNVITALTGSLAFKDWKAKKILDTGKNLLNHRSL